MIQIQTYLTVNDNSGGKTLKCIATTKKGSFTRFANIGELIVVSIKTLRTKNKFRSKIKTGEVAYALVTKTKVGLKRKNGIKIKFNTNAAILLNNQFKPLATRIFGAVPQEFREAKFFKLISLASGVI